MAKHDQGKAKWAPIQVGANEALIFLLLLWFGEATNIDICNNKMQVFERDWTMHYRFNNHRSWGEGSMCFFSKI